MTDERADIPAFRFAAIGTQWEIETAEPVDDEMREGILGRIEAFDATYSRFRPDSLVSRVAATGGRFEFPEDSAALFDLYDRLHEATGGAVDPLVGRGLELLGYDASYSLTPAPAGVRAKAYAGGSCRWSEDVRRDGTTIITRRPLLIDVGAAGKGYLVDIVSGLLREAGHTRFVVDASGDLRHSGDPGLRIGLEHPFETETIIGLVDLKDRAICASAINRRAWGEGLHHVLDARTGLPVRDVVATWAIADDAATADGLATALFFAGGGDLSREFRFSWIRVFANGRAEAAPDFSGKIFFSGQNDQDVRGMEKDHGRA